MSDETKQSTDEGPESDSVDDAVHDAPVTSSPYDEHGVAPSETDEQLEPTDAPLESEPYHESSSDHSDDQVEGRRTQHLDQEQKRSPVEAFSELRAEVRGLHANIENIGSFVQTCREKLLGEADDYRAEGKHDILQSLMRIYDIVFQRVIAMESGNERPDRFIIDLFETIEAELNTHGIEIVRPQPGDPIDLQVMTTVGAVPCPFWRKSDRVAQVVRCGFIYKMEVMHRNSRKAEITVFRK